MIYILIPIFNRIDKTIKCLDSIYRQDFRDISVIVVDDGSSDGSKQIIKEAYPKTIVLDGTGSLFWTGAVYFGVNYILKICNKEDWILLVNNDVQLAQNTIDKLVSFSRERGQKAIVNALSVNQKNNRIIKSGTIVKSWILNITRHVCNGERISKLMSLDAIKVDLLTGRCLLHPVGVFREIGNYNARVFPHYGGDDEFTARAKRFGYELYVLPSAIVYLDDEKSISNMKIFEKLFGIRSSINLINKWNFTMHVVPLYARMTYFIIAVLKSIVILFKR